jgi:hypothetical protein
MTGRKGDETKKKQKKKNRGQGETFGGEWRFLKGEKQRRKTRKKERMRARTYKKPKEKNKRTRR